MKDLIHNSAHTQRKGLFKRVRGGGVMNELEARGTQRPGPDAGREHRTDPRIDWTSWTHESAVTIAEWARFMSIRVDANLDASKEPLRDRVIMDAKLPKMVHSNNKRGVEKSVARRFARHRVSENELRIPDIGFYRADTDVSHIRLSSQPWRLGHYPEHNASCGVLEGKRWTIRERGADGDCVRIEAL